MKGTAVRRCAGSHPRTKHCLFYCRLDPKQLKNLRKRYSRGRIGEVDPWIRIRKKKEFYIHGWGKESFRIDIYFQEQSDGNMEPYIPPQDIEAIQQRELEEADSKKPLSSLIEMRSDGDDDKYPNYLIDQMYLNERSELLSYLDLNFNEKGWTVANIQHLHYMGHFKYLTSKGYAHGHRFTLEQILFDEANQDWDGKLEQELPVPQACKYNRPPYQHRRWVEADDGWWFTTNVDFYPRFKCGSDSQKYTEMKILDRIQRGLCLYKNKEKEGQNFNLNTTLTTEKQFWDERGYGNG